MLKKTIGNRWILGAMLVAGINIAGSDGKWFPWINIAGLLMFCCAVFIAKHVFKDV